MKILVIAGGTGGHIYPALSIAQQFKKNGNIISWIGKKESLEEKICHEEGFQFFPIKSKGFLGKSFISKMESLFFLFLGFLISSLYLLKIKPDFIVSTGGYISLAPGLVGSFYCPLVIHEQNSIPGLANRVLSKRSALNLEAFQNTFEGQQYKTFWVGNPVRSEITTAEKKINNDGHTFNILVLGGSQGSQQINEILTRAFKEKEALPNWKIVHQVGSLDKKLLEESYKSSGVRYELVEYINNMGEIYADTDMVISRAGAMTLSEICEHNIPSILIPLPWSAEDHQYKNALHMHRLGASELIESDINNSDRLFELLIKMEKDHNKRDFMASASAKVFPKSSAKLIYAKINESLKIQT